MQPLLAVWHSLVWLQDHSYCSIPAWPGWHLSFVSLAQIRAWWQLRGPSSCSMCTAISSLLSFFPTVEGRSHLLFLSCLIKKLIIAELFSSYTGLEDRVKPAMLPWTLPGFISSDASLCFKEAEFNINDSGMLRCLIRSPKNICH